METTLEESVVATDIAHFIARVTNIPEGEELETDAPLVTLGLMTSLVTTEILAFAQERYQVRIGMESITARNFATANSIAALVVQTARTEDAA